jgi:hypothetical protein
MNLVFNAEGHVVFVGEGVPNFDIPVTVAKLEEGQEYLPEYSYSYSEVDGELIAVQGEPLNIDYSERDAEIARTAYIYNREMQYPSIQEQLDMQYWDSVNGTTVWADTIAAVKAANPKPE